MDYQFLLGRSFNFGDRDWVVEALGRANGRTIVRASPGGCDDAATREFPADLVCQHLLVDEVIELRLVSFAG